MRPLPTRTPTQEIELILLLKHRDERSFRILYEQYAPNLLRVALKIVGSPAIAQDVLQEAFVKIWSRIDAYEKGKGRLFTWLLAVVRNTALDQLRAQKRESVYLLCRLECSLLPAEGRAIHQTAAHYLAVDYTPVDHIGLEQALAVLSQEQRNLIDYLYLKGYTQAEAAQALNIPLGTVKSKLRTAMLQLRGQVGQESTFTP